MAALAPGAGAAESGFQSLAPMRRTSTALNGPPVWLTIPNPLTPAVAGAAIIVARRKGKEAIRLVMGQAYTPDAPSFKADCFSAQAAWA
jgi:hypothetical protein